MKPLLAPVWKPHDYQKKAEKVLLDNGAAMLLLDPGLGKTGITLSAFTKLLKQGKARRALIIAPLRVCYQVWPTEAAQWKQFQGLRVGVLHGKDKNEILENFEDYDVLVINPEGLEWLLTGGTGRFDKRRWHKLMIDTLVIDELTKFKKPSGKRFKMLKWVIPTFLRRWGLTGTPAPNGLLDLFGQCYVIDEGNALGRYITHYRAKYFRPLDPNGWKWALQPGAEELIYEALRPLALRMSAKDYLEMPELVNIRHMITLPAKVRKIYDTLEDDLMAKYGEGLIVAGNSAAASTKCRQLCNGAIYVDDDIASLLKGKSRRVLEVHDEKLNAVEELVDELQGTPLLLAYEFNHDLDRLLKKFPGTPYIGKGINAKQSLLVERQWNEGKMPLLFAHPASAGHGLNLQKGQAHHVGWFGVTWDYELYDQFIRRILRQGNKNKRVFNHLFVAADTVDLLSMYDKTRKERNQLKLFDALADMRKARGK